MESKQIIIAVAILIFAQYAPGQDYLSRDYMSSEAVYAVAASRNIATNERAEPQDQTDSNPKRGKHNIQLRFGLLSDNGVDSQVSANVLASIVGGNGFIGSIAFNYWVWNELAVSVSVGVIGSEVNTSVGGSRASVETSSVIPILLGVKYQPWRMAITENVRPFVFGSVGLYVGSATRTFNGTGLRNEIYSETALGSHFGLGTDLELSRLFVVGVSAGYYLTTDFGRPIGAQKNYSSPEFSLSLGVLF